MLKISSYLIFRHILEISFTYNRKYKLVHKHNVLSADKRKGAILQSYFADKLLEKCGHFCPKQCVILINPEFVDFGQTRSTNQNISGLFGYTFICG